MKKTFVVLLLVVSMLTMVGFAPVEASYWEELKEVYTWEGMESHGEIELAITLPMLDLDLRYEIQMYSQLGLKEFDSYMEIEVEDLKGEEEIPTIKMYTHGTDLYVGTEIIHAFLETIGLGEVVEIEEAYVMLKSSEEDIQIDANFLQEVVALLEEMDLGMELGMTKEGNTYTLSLDSDTIIDLFDAYMLYVFNNIEKFASIVMPASVEMEITEEEKQEALDQYNNFIRPYLEVARVSIAGSYYDMVSIFDEGEFYEEVELFIMSPMMKDAKVEIKMTSTATRLEELAIQLPTSVMVVTEEELNEMVMGMFMVPPIPAEYEEPSIELKVVMDTRGNYAKPTAEGVVENWIPLEVRDGRTYIAVEDASYLLDTTFEGREGSLWIRELEEYGFIIEWDAETGRTAIFQY